MVIVTIENFFSKKFEIESTNILIDNPSYFSSSMMEEYVIQLMKYDLKTYINYLSEHPIKAEITSRDITQLSSIDDCTINVCIIMIQCGNKELTLIEIASKLYGKDSYKNTIVALTKYGKNQVKTACQMRLTILKNDLWFLSGIGSVFGTLTGKTQNKYLSINLLRDSFYSRVILSLCKSDTNLRDFMSFLSESTQKRRASSCMRVITFFLNQCNLEGIQIYNLTSI